MNTRTFMVCFGLGILSLAIAAFMQHKALLFLSFGFIIGLMAVDAVKIFKGMWNEQK